MVYPQQQCVCAYHTLGPQNAPQAFEQARWRKLWYVDRSGQILAKSTYHFTSPIRRYPDLLVHRAIKAVLAGETYTPDRSWDDIGLQCSSTERRADEATRDVENWLKTFFMKERIGEEFDGTISGVTAFGIFVALDTVYIEGLVHVSELGAD